ncbi:3-oxoacyl-ACP synthase [Maribacter sp. 2308TA10-17]|uniref:3-oxoacyl-ACP synthase n=1 Tax=Maribacter sp. 2308TA10-17 TaxID=3386276 RepID=UPI0039BD03CF
MNNDYHIQQYCHVRNNDISLDGISLYSEKHDSFKDFAKATYKHLEIDHSKFFKMDNLSKLAFLAADALLNQETEKNIGLVLSNKAASLDTDRKHQESIKDYPSPAVFVYTLPNICLGEISIKHQLYSENGFFVFDSFNAESLHTYANSLLDEEKSEKVLCGWVNFDDGKYDAFLYVVAKKGTFVHSVAEINRLY